MRRAGVLGKTTPLSVSHVLRGQLTDQSTLSGPARIAAPSPRVVTATDVVLQPTGFTSQQWQDFTTFWNKARSHANAIYGLPAPEQRGKVVRVVVNNNAGDGYYERPESAASAGGRISYQPYVPGDFQDDFCDAACGVQRARDANNFNLLKLVLFSYKGKYQFNLDAWELGFANAAALLTLYNAQGKPASFDPVESIFYPLPIYDFLNRPDLGNKHFVTSGSGLNGLASLRISMAMSAWLKVYAENPAFFRQFHESYYSQGIELQDNAEGLIQLASKYAPSVEGLTFQDWYRRQYVLDTSIKVGDKLWAANYLVDGDRLQGKLFLGTAQYYRTTSRGDEIPLSGKMTVQAFDETGTDITAKSPDLARKNSFDFGVYERGYAETSYPVGEDLAYPYFRDTGSPDSGLFTLKFQTATAEATAYLPSGVLYNGTSRNGFFGGVVGSSKGAVTVKTTYGAPKATLARGAFGAALAYRSQPSLKTQFILQPTDGAAPREFTRNTGWSINQGKPYSVGVLLETSPGNAAVTHTFKRSGSNQWRLISLPLHPAESNENRILPGAKDYARYRTVALPSPSLSGINLKFGITGEKHDLYPNIRESFAPGRGMWVRLTSDLTATIRGGEPSRARPFEVPLGNGWNMVGVPYNLWFQLGALQVRRGSLPPVSWNEAINKGWISPGVWRWKPEGGYARVDTNVSSRLEPWEGYYLHSTVARDLFLVFDATKRVAQVVPVPLPISATNWQATLSVSARSGTQSGLNFGMVPLVNNVPALLPAAQPPLGERAPTLTFLSTGVIPASASREVGLADGFFRPTTSTLTWQFIVDGAQPGETVSINWSDLNLVPKRYRWELSEYGSSTKIPMISANGLRRYSFVAGTGGRRFVMTATPLSAGVVATRSLSPSRGVQIVWMAQQSGSAELMIETTQGSVVREIGASRELVAGQSTTWLWDGRDNEGHALSAGSYVARVRWVDAHGEAQTLQQNIELR
jgi:hypothetical protein